MRYKGVNIVTENDKLEYGKYKGCMYKDLPPEYVRFLVMDMRKKLPMLEALLGKFVNDDYSRRNNDRYMRDNGMKNEGIYVREEGLPPLKPKEYTDYKAPLIEIDPKAPWD